MDNAKFKEYITSFEKDIIIEGFEQGAFSRKGMVPNKKGRLMSTDYGSVLGISFEYSKPLAIDYYGLVKKSTGLIKEFDDLLEKGIHVTSMKTAIVFFASVKIEDIEALRPELVADFPAFKKRLIALRGFKNGRKNPV